jgi:hypothetical protein
VRGLDGVHEERDERAVWWRWAQIATRSSYTRRSSLAELLVRREEAPKSVKDLLLLKSLRAVGEVAVLTQALGVGHRCSSAASGKT